MWRVVNDITLKQRRLTSLPKYTTNLAHQIFFLRKEFWPLPLLSSSKRRRDFRPAKVAQVAFAAWCANHVLPPFKPQGTDARIPANRDHEPKGVGSGCWSHSVLGLGDSVSNLPTEACSKGSKLLAGELSKTSKKTPEAAELNETSGGWDSNPAAEDCPTLSILRRRNSRRSTKLTHLGVNRRRANSEKLFD